MSSVRAMFGPTFLFGLRPLRLTAASPKKKRLLGLLELVANEQAQTTHARSLSSTFVSLIMLRNGKKPHDEQALLGWSMLEHDDTFTDNYAFDGSSSPSLERTSGDAHSAGLVRPSDPANLRFSEKSASKQAFAASALSSLAMLKSSTHESAATPEEETSCDVRDVPRVAVSVDLPHTAGGQSRRGLETNAWISNFVQDDSRERLACRSSTGVRGSRRRRRVHEAHRDHSVIEESSSEDSAGGGGCRNATDGAMIVDEASESESSSNSIHTPLLQSPLLSAAAPLSSVLAAGFCEGFGQTSVHEDGEAVVSEAVEDLCPRIRKRGVVKKGLESLLLFARQKEENSNVLAARRRSHGNSEFLPGTALSVRVLTVENIYGTAYCACEVYGAEQTVNTRLQLCVQVPWEVVAREELGTGDVIRVYPPWKEYEIRASPGKVISAAKNLEVVERYSRGTTAD